MNEKIIKEYIRALEHITGFMRNLLEEEKKIPVSAQDDLKEITNLRFLAKSEAWPEAVPSSLLCGDDEDAKLSRATVIVQEYITSDVLDKKFLDFGCGEGHVPFIVSSLFAAKKSVGYDVKEQSWSTLTNKNRDLPNFILTTDWDEVIKNGPYDVILANDVIDHSFDPLAALKKIQEAKKPIIGKVFMRCHPWTSRHGTHIYKQLNKAYLHLVFTPEELYAMGLKEMVTQPALHPLDLYRSMIKDAGFTILSEETVDHPVEMFFTHNPEILRRIKEKWQSSPDPELANGTKFPREIMELQFVDYCLI